jgi:hypothetical protein
MPGTIYVDNDGHPNRQGGTALTAGAVSTSAAGTISPTTSAGASPTVTFTTGFACDDAGGTFELNPVTGGGGQAAGQVALVRFAKPYPKIPNVTVSMVNHTDTTAAIVVGAGTVTAAGFDVWVGTALTTAKVYRVSYVVTPQPVTP